MIPDPLKHKDMAPGRIARLNMLLLAVLAVILALIQKENNDIWWHLRTGRLLVETRAFPRSDIYSFSAAGNPWVLHEWLSQIIFYGIHAAGGEKTLALFRPVFLLTALFFVFAAALTGSKPFGKPGMQFLIFLVYMALLAVWPRIIIRPHLLSFCMITLFLFILMRNQIRRDGILYLLPVLQVIWINLHGLAVLGAIMCGAFLAGGLLDLRGRRQGRAAPIEGQIPPAAVWKPLAIVTLLAVLCLFINPCTYGIFGELKSLGKEYSAISEWRSPLEISPLHATPLLFYWLYLVMTLPLVIVSFRRMPWAHRLIYAGFLFLSLRSIRNIELFFLVTIPPVFQAAMCFLEDRKPRLFNRRGQMAWGLALSVLLLATGAKAAIYGMRPSRGGRIERPAPGVGLLRPDGAIQYVLKNNLPGNMFNDYDIGGYILWHAWPRLKVAIDGRTLVYGPDLFQRFTNLDPMKLERLVKDYSIGYFILKRRTGNVNLHRHLDSTGEWPLVYFDDEALVYVNRAMADPALLKSDEFRYLNPVLFDLPAEAGGLVFDPRFVPEYIEEGRRVLELHPADIAGYEMAGYILFNAGRFDEAIDFYEKGIQIQRDYFAHFTPLAFCHQKAGNLKQAGRLYKKALRLNPRDEFARNKLAEIRE